MKVSLEGRTALVTGASRGVGFAMASRFARSGADVVLLARRADVLENARREIEEHSPGKVLAYDCDVIDRAAVAEVYADLKKRGRNVDILVNNAGLSANYPFDRVSDDDMMEDYELKVVAAANFIRHALPDMKQRNWGRIINIVSIMPKMPGRSGTPTLLSRAAGIALSKSLASELGPWSILVNALCLGQVQSDQWTVTHKKYAPELSYEEYLRSRLSDVPLGRIGTAEEVANIACFLASDLASYITGTAINVDGGRCPAP